MMMLVMGGAEMLVAMAADPDLRQIPLVILSSLPEAVVRTSENGAAAIMHKPYTAEGVLGARARVFGEAK
jgi:CheY-like chemotaxis protein